MKHVSDIDLIELVGDHLPRDQRRAVEEHLALCAPCRERLEGFAQASQRLGEWQVATEGHDLRAAVLATAQEDRLAVAQRRRRRLWGALKAAAVILVGFGMGGLAGRLARPRGEQAHVAEADAQAVAESLSLTVLEEPAPAGLAESVLGIDPTAEEGAS